MRFRQESSDSARWMAEKRWSNTVNYLSLSGSRGSLFYVLLLYINMYIYMFIYTSIFILFCCLHRWTASVSSDPSNGFVKAVVVSSALSDASWSPEGTAGGDASPLPFFFVFFSLPAWFYVEIEEYLLLLFFLPPPFSFFSFFLWAAVWVGAPSNWLYISF